MKILFLSRWFPFPPDNGSKIRIFNLLNGLAQYHEITLLSFHGTALQAADAQGQNQVFSEVKIVPWKTYNQHTINSKIGFFSITPRFLRDTYSHEMETLIQRALSRQKYDIVIASQLSMASYFKSIRGIPAIFEEIELGIFYDRAFHQDGSIKSLRAWLTWYKLKLYLSHLLDSFAGCTVVSEKERRLVVSNFNKHAAKVMELPNCINVVDYQNISAKKKVHHIIFSGSFSYNPNYHAMQWFTGRVHPLILEEIPDAQLIITGNHADLPLNQSDNVTHVGYVDDIRPLLASCDVSIAPLWIGGGTRLKILEAMAAGIPVVATSKGAEGLLVNDGEHILIADEPRKFAEHVISLLVNPDLREYLSSRALQLVNNYYNWPAVMPKFLNQLETAVQG